MANDVERRPLGDYRRVESSARLAGEENSVLGDARRATIQTRGLLCIIIASVGGLILILAKIARVLVKP
jgi:hypothetical protein